MPSYAGILQEGALSEQGFSKQGFSKQVLDRTAFAKSGIKLRDIHGKSAAFVDRPNKGTFSVSEDHLAKMINNMVAAMVSCIF